MKYTIWEAIINRLGTCTTKFRGLDDKADLIENLTAMGLTHYK